MMVSISHFGSFLQLDRATNASSTDVGMGFNMFQCIAWPFPYLPFHCPAIQSFQPVDFPSHEYLRRHSDSTPWISSSSIFVPSATRSFGPPHLGRSPRGARGDTDDEAESRPEPEPPERPAQASSLKRRRRRSEAARFWVGTKTCGSWRFPLAIWVQLSFFGMF